MESLIEDVVFKIITEMDLYDIKMVRITNKYLGDICQIYMEKNYW